MWENGIWIPGTWEKNWGQEMRVTALGTFGLGKGIDITPPPPHPISTISQSYWVPIIKLVFYKIKTLSSASCNVRYSLQKHVHLNVHLLRNCLCGGFPVGSKFQP